MPSRSLVKSCKNCQKEFARGFSKGKNSVLRKNQSGCCCIIDDNDAIISLCGAHQTLIDKAISGKMKKQKSKINFY